MSIITPRIFKAEITISQKSNPYMSDNIQEFIDKYERKFLLELFGVIFYTEFMTALNTPPTDEKWYSLADNADLKLMIANYVYYWYKQDETTQSMGISEAKPKAENASVTNSISKQVRTWNEMVRMVRLFDLDTTIYPDFVKRVWYGTQWDYFYYVQNRIPEIYKYKNTFDV